MLPPSPRNAFVVCANNSALRADQFAGYARMALGRVSRRTLSQPHATIFSVLDRLVRLVTVRMVVDSYAFDCWFPSKSIGLLQANKKHSFHSWRWVSGRRRCQSPEQSGAGGRGSEHGAILGYAPARAAQARLTEGAERS
jgi:hypothetical protein